MISHLVAVLLPLLASSPSAVDHHALQIVPRIWGVSNSGVYTVSETRDLEGKTLSVATLPHNGDTVKTSSGTNTRFRWICGAVFDSLGLKAFNPGPLGEAPQIDLTTFTESILVPQSVIPRDSLIPDSLHIDHEEWDYKLTWLKPLLLTKIIRTYNDGRAPLTIVLDTPVTETPAVTAVLPTPRSAPHANRSAVFHPTFATGTGTVNALGR